MAPIACMAESRDSMRSYVLKQIDEQTIELKYTSAGWRGRFPGELKTTVTYHLTNENEVVISYQASTDKSHGLESKPIILILTYPKGDPFYIGDHILTINATHYLPTDNTAILGTDLKRR